MSDEHFITPVEVRPGMHVEIMQSPWRGVIVEGLGIDATFRARRDGTDPDSLFPLTSWSVDAIGSIRLLTDPLPKTPGERFWGCLPGCAPIWWFTTRGRNDDASPLVTVWIGEDGGEVHEDDVEFVGLVRIPEPEVAL